MSIVLGGKTPEQLGFRILMDTVEPALPETRDRTLQIDGRHGLYDFGADLAERRFEFPCAMLKADVVALQRAERELTAHLVDGYGRPKTMELIINSEPEKVYTVRYAGSLTPQRMVGLGRFTLPLVAYDPFAYVPMNAYDNTLHYDAGLAFDSGLMYPNPPGIDWMYYRQMAGLYNYSNMITPLTLSFVGNVGDVLIKSLTTGQQMQISGQVTSMELKQLAVSVNGSNGLPRFSGDFIELLPGTNELIFEGNSPAGVITFNWKHKFI